MGSPPPEAVQAGEVRAPAPDVFDWDRKPGTVWFPVAHHEAGRADVTARAARAVEELAEYRQRHPKKARAR
ncbi:hypothetical protein AB0B30_23270 [Streptomyces narbonensis]|uniref:Uncharacterized protein n=1 Tax=Streptomyces narbonensis TaxID=67333 RepID=A0ABV3CKF0_9ACTN